MKMESLINLWVNCNAKKITQEDFFKKTGFHFSSFGYSNKKLCLLAWNEYHKNESLKFKQVRKKHRQCICEEQKNKTPNSYRISDKLPERLWKCPVHGNCFIEVVK
ncbi:MAG: hypothetical protein NUV80_01210 [Candidatus Berkelbacteria bacterium]|nr:hypothetical protein [Candidatus Berkelbacteria bacterium]